MTSEQWKSKMKNKEVPIRLHIANHEIPLESISYISEILIKDRIAGFDIYMKDGPKIEYFYDCNKLEPIYETKGFIFKREVLTKDTQRYFNRKCENLKKVESIQQKCINALMQYNRFKTKRYRLI